jgi:hypothetical protein
MFVKPCTNRMEKHGKSFTIVLLSDNKQHKLLKHIQVACMCTGLIICFTITLKMEIIGLFNFMPLLLYRWAKSLRYYRRLNGWQNRPGC